MSSHAEFAYAARPMKSSLGSRIAFLVLLSAVTSGCDFFLKPPPPVGDEICTEGLKNCGGTCFDLQIDANHCGTCDTACGSGEFCVLGKCEASCPSALLACTVDGVTGCFDTQSDNNNCGTCNNVCGAGTVCSDGACRSNCASDQVLCNGRCIEPLVSRENCGASGDCQGANAGATCGSTQVCSAGTCASQCPSVQVACNGTCIDPQTDPLRCGAKGDCLGANAGVACLGGEVCAGGECRANCPSDQLACGGRCVDPLTDLGFCGAAGDCKGANAGARCAPGELCSAGACGTSCPSGQLVCSGQCINSNIDPIHCGASTDCKGANAGTACLSGKACANGVCGLSCPAGQLICGGKCVDPLLDPVFCGASLDCLGANQGATCGAGQVCSAGQCKTSCVPGQLNCNGTCIDPMTNRTYCGATGTCGVDGGVAGTSCTVGQICTGGSCALTCQAGYVNCNGTCVDPQSSRAYCGATAGCGVGSGSAGAACGAGQICASGACRTTCASGQVDCNGVCVDPGTNRAYCGATAGCGVDGGVAGSTCPPGLLCSGGGCQLTCKTGQVVCGGVCTDPLTSRAFCGATAGCGAGSGSAGAVCNAGELCVAGACKLTCPPGLIQCGSTCIDPMSNPLFCGATPGCGAGMGIPGAACGMNAACFMGACASLVIDAGVPDAGMMGGPPVTYSQNFTALATSVPQCSAWDTWRSQLTGSYTSMTIRGTFDMTGVTCANATLVNQLATAIKNDTALQVTCSGRKWSFCNSGSIYGYTQLWLDSPSTNPCDPSNCFDPSFGPPTGYVVSPCAGGSSWGGVNTQTCTNAGQMTNAPTQLMEVIFTP